MLSGRDKILNGWTTLFIIMEMNIRRWEKQTEIMDDTV